MSNADIAFAGWYIDRDYLNNESNSRFQGPGSAVGMGGESSGANGPGRVLHGDTVWTRDVSRADILDPVRFRMLDGDGVVYFGGVIDRSWLEGDEEYAFDPLAYGRTFGCTSFQYQKKYLGWQDL